MKVFLSWSGEFSKEIAIALKDWLPLVLNEVDPFISTSIDAGARWQAEIASHLEESLFGIVIVTAENQNKPWLNFEAGAIAKAVETSRLVPLAVDLRPSDIKLPLGQFQAQSLNISGITKVVESMNSTLSRPLSKEHLDRALSLWWPDLDTKTSAIVTTAQKSTEPSTTRRTERDLLEEILTTVRQIRIADPVTPAVVSQDKDRRLLGSQLANAITLDARKAGVVAPECMWNSTEFFISFNENTPHSFLVHVANLAGKYGFPVTFSPIKGDERSVSDIQQGNIIRTNTKNRPMKNG